MRNRHGAHSSRLVTVQTNDNTIMLLQFKHLQYRKIPQQVDKRQGQKKENAGIQTLQIQAKSRCVFGGAISLTRCCYCLPTWVSCHPQQAFQLIWPRGFRLCFIIQLRSTNFPLTSISNGDFLLFLKSSPWMPIPQLTFGAREVIRTPVSFYQPKADQTESPAETVLGRSRARENQ